MCKHDEIDLEKMRDYLWKRYLKEKNKKLLNPDQMREAYWTGVQDCARFLLEIEKD